MTSKEKAKELVDRYKSYIQMADKYGDLLSSQEIYFAKQCALIAVDETIKALNVLLNSDLNNDFDILKLRGEYMELKSEIEKL
jgi:hypothetical protein